MANFNLISPIIDLSKAIPVAKENYLRFDIAGPGVYFSGILKNKPKFSMTGEYDRLINMDSTFANLNKGLNFFTGKVFGVSKTWTKQIFKGGSYLTIALETRILAEDKPVKHQVASLAKLVAPNTLFQETDAEGGVLDSVVGFIDRTFDTSNELDTTSIKNNIKGFISGGVSNAPSEVAVTISNYFHLNGFLVKSVEWTFSHEQTTSDDGVVGPIYADLSIELMQSEIRKSGEIQTAFSYDRKLNTNG